MLSREQRGQRREAAASVVVDRLIGLYLLFVVATLAILLTGFWRLPVVEIRNISHITFLLTALGACGLVLLFLPGFTDGRGSQALARLPRICATVEKILDAVRMYRRKPGVLIAASLMSVGVHSLFATGVYCIACGLPGDVLSLGTHFVIMPLSAATGVLPPPMGPFEFVLEFLYTHVPADVTIPTGQGLVVALGYRLITLLTAVLGIYYYLASRREVAEVIQVVEQTH